ncbi:PLAT [Mytilus edulis]|uniref:PLAT n=1 Tax=Mytilus edulis TaxID=6550 RepID=A0A8S3QL31_MYTED|nr:PLAT [Mytilus edulis]
MSTPMCPVNTNKSTVSNVSIDSLITTEIDRMMYQIDPQQSDPIIPGAYDSVDFLEHCGKRPTEIIETDNNADLITPSCGKEIAIATNTNIKCDSYIDKLLGGINEKAGTLDIADTSVNIETSKCGKGGVAIMYKKTLKFNIKPINCPVSERILGIEIQCNENYSIFVFSVYLPADSNIQNYKYEMNIVEDYVSNFSKFGPVIVADVTCYFESDKGEAYNGTVNTTADGTPCKNWKTYNSPHAIYYSDHNYCRNPQTDALTQPWCYTADRYAFAFCNIDVCGRCLNLPFVSSGTKQIYL